MLQQKQLAISILSKEKNIMSNAGSWHPVILKQKVDSYVKTWKGKGASYNHFLENNYK